MKNLDVLVEDFKKINEEHNSIGYVDSYIDRSYLFDQYQNHFYISQVMQGTLTHPELPRVFSWFDDIKWKGLYTDRYVYSHVGDPGSFEINGMFFKDRYFDYSRACIPYALDKNLDLYVNYAIRKLPELIFTKKPPRMVYLVGAIMHKNTEHFEFWYRQVIKNIPKLNELYEIKVDK